MTETQKKDQCMTESSECGRARISSGPLDTPPDRYYLGDKNAIIEFAARFDDLNPPEADA